MYTIKKPQCKTEALILTLAVLTFPGRYQPSIISVVSLTSVFGMGTGVSLQLYPPENFSKLTLAVEISVIVS
jgi:hypothetical protein